MSEKRRQRGGERPLRTGSGGPLNDDTSPSGGEEVEAQPAGVSLSLDAARKLADRLRNEANWYLKNSPNSVMVEMLDEAADTIRALCDEVEQLRVQWWLAAEQAFLGEQSGVIAQGREEYLAKRAEHAEALVKKLEDAAKEDAREALLVLRTAIKEKEAAEALLNKGCHAVCEETDREGCIFALEAEVKRLREALEEIADGELHTLRHMGTGLNGAVYKARAALDQKGEQ